MRSCCFIGHRKLSNKELVVQCIKKTVVSLLTDHDVRVFLFGSKSEFDNLCHITVSELQKEHSDIIMVNYNLKNEYVVKKDEKAEPEKIGAAC